MGFFDEVGLFDVISTISKFLKVVGKHESKQEIKSIGKSLWIKWSKQLIATRQYVNYNEKLSVTYIDVEEGNQN